jgi:4-amino-4-deoxy-L-arabinose transferase-like glycosyltransferase
MSGAMRTAVFGALVAAIATLPGLGTGTLWDNSETAYGEVAREILLTHDWVVMHLNLTPWFVQPPLYFWIAAAFAKVFGVAPFAFRLPSALATVAMGATIGYATTTLAGSRVGMYGAIVLSTSLMQAVIGRMAIMDALLDLATAIGILALFRAFTGGRPVMSVLGAGLAIALGILAKGPVAFVVVALVIVPWFVWERYAGARLTYPPVWSWFAALALLLAIDTPWFVLFVSHAGPSAFEELIGHYTFGRYVGTIENQSGPIWYYVPVVILGFFPWIAYLPGAIGAAWRHAITPNGLSVHVARLALVWSIVPFVFFSLAGTKLPNYLAVELPALAILVALWFDQLAQGEHRRSAMIATAVIPLTIGAVAIAIAAFARDAHILAGAQGLIGDLSIMGAIIFIGSIATLVFLWMDRTESAPYVFAATAIVMVTYAIMIAEPQAERFKPVPQLAAIIREHVRDGDAVAIQGVAGGYGLIFATQPPVDVIGAGADAHAAICSASRAFLITSTERARAIAVEGREKHVVATSGNDVLLLFTSTRPEPVRC